MDVLGFWSRVGKGRPDGCWEWQGRRLKSGHGRAWWDGEGRGAHCVAYELMYGEYERNGDVEICHKCHNASCVNPRHLYKGTWQENLKDMQEDGKYFGAIRHGYGRTQRCR